MAETETAVNPLDAVVEQIIAKAESDTQALHDLVKSYKQASGTRDEINEWIEKSEDAEIVKKRTAIKNALAKIAELKSELEDAAKEALVPEGYDPNAVAKEFKDLRTAVKTLILQSKGVIHNLRGADYDVSALDQLFENLPNISGGVTASGKSPAELADARKWLQENGHPEVASRGRIAKDLLAEYDARAKS